MSYKVKLPIFEGPLDLLLFLIKKEKIEINDIPIAKVTKQYMEYLDLMQVLDLDIAGEFLVMAATLMHIKSKMLLPPDETAEEEAEMEDPREELVRRLLEYKKFKDAAEKLHQMKDEQKDVFLRRSTGSREKVFVEGEGEYFEASLFDLITAFSKVLRSVSKETFHKVVKDEFTVSDKIHDIFHLLAADSKICFSDLFKGADSKDEVIVTFLAVLELIKMHEILVVQEEPFSEIQIIRIQEPVRSQREEVRPEAEEQENG